MAYVNKKPDLVHIIRQLERRVRQLENATPLRNASISTGGEITFTDSSVTLGEAAEFNVVSPEGTHVLHAGALSNGDYGVEISRENGVIALRVSKPFVTSGEQVVAVFDKSGNVIFSDAIFSENGADAPFLDYVFRPVTTPEERSTSLTTFDDLFEWRGKKHNAYIMPTLRVRCSDGTTSGEVRIVDRLSGDTVLYGFFQPSWTGTVALGTTADTEMSPPYGLLVNGTAGADVHFVVQGRVTAGAGSLTVSMAECHGVVA